MITIYLVILINGITFALIAVLVGFLNYATNDTLNITAPIEVLVVLIVAIVITSVLFR
jgi:hypothetical protein